MAVLGYDEDERWFIIQDSRGESFGQGGQWFLSYNRLKTNRIRVAYAIGAPQFGGLL